jgi:hypothetical protein
MSFVLWLINTAKTRFSFKDQSVYEGKPAGRGAIWTHEGYYIEEGKAQAMAEKHDGVYRYVTGGIYDGSYEVFAKLSKAAQILLRAKATT